MTLNLGYKRPTDAHGRILLFCIEINKTVHDPTIGWSKGEVIAAINVGVCLDPLA